MTLSTTEVGTNVFSRLLLPAYLDYPRRFFNTFQGNPVDKRWRGEKLERNRSTLVCEEKWQE